MNLSIVFYFLGKVMFCESALMVLPFAVSLFYKEYHSAQAFLLAILLCGFLGVLLSLRKPKDATIHIREGFVITALSWILISIMGAIPFLADGAITNPINAVFEVVSGFTTTGSSILTDVEALSHGMLFWRSFTHWIGGMGVLVFILILTPKSSGSTMNIMKAESPGPQVEKFVPKVRSTAVILYSIYIAMTITQIFLLLAGGMPLFDALTTTFGTAGTGGFGIKNDSIAGYSTYLQSVVTVFMVLFGVNFSFYFLLLHKKFRRAFFLEEVRWYVIIILAAIGIITFNIKDMYDSVGQALHHAAFHVSAIITTTGYTTTDFDLWPQTAKTILVFLMFIGACAGSTGGGVKVSRILVLVKTVAKEIRTFLHPQRVGKICLDHKTVPHEVVRSVNVFLVTYVLIFAGSVFLLSFDNQDLITNFTAVAATLNNIGPGLSGVGPTQNFSLFSNTSQLVLIFDMLAGRLELFPILLLFTKDCWRKF